MDEFHDVDKELDRLKAELAGQDDAIRRFRAPASGDYWQRRLDEEKILWNKKAIAREEEKKALEARLTQQQVQIDQYNNQLNDMERRLDSEAREWEQRLKAKEADLLIEKNRLLSEEKVKHVEIENHRLLEQIAELNEKIAILKDEHEGDKKKLHESFGGERTLYEEKIKAYLAEIDLLHEKIVSLEGDVARHLEELKNARQDYAAQLSRADDGIAKLQKEKAAVESEKGALQKEIVEVKARGEDEKKALVGRFREADLSLLEHLRMYTGPLTGLIGFMARYRTTAAVYRVFTQLVGSMENELETYSVLTELSPGVAKFKLACCVSDEEYAHLEPSVPKLSAETLRLQPASLLKDIQSAKPQVVVISGAHRALGEKIRARWPFLPVIFFGDMPLKTVRKMKAGGFELILPPYAPQDVAGMVLSAAAHSVARPEFWDIIKVRKSKTVPALAAAALLVAGVIGYGLATGSWKQLAAFPDKSSYTTPYAQPTSIAFDGNYLWTCDWTGQSLYRHGSRGQLTLDRIFYFPGKHFTALTCVDGYLWSADPWEKKIFKHNMDQKMSIVGTYPAPNSAPSGLAGDGKVLWSCDAARAEIYRHKLDENLTIEAAYNSPGPSPSGLYFDGSALWSIDSKTNKIYKHAMDNDLTVVASHIPPDFEQKSYNLSGITGNSTTLWICSEKAAKIYKYPIGDGVKITR